MSVTLYKLVSGEEIIASVVRESDQHVEITDCVTLVYQRMDGGRMSVGFAPYMPYAEGKIRLNNQAIASSSGVSDQVLQEYNRTFSKIMIASANSI